MRELFIPPTLLASSNVIPQADAKRVLVSSFMGHMWMTTNSSQHKAGGSVYQRSQIRNYTETHSLHDRARSEAATKDPMHDMNFQRAMWSHVLLAP